MDYFTKKIQYACIVLILTGVFNHFKLYMSRNYKLRLKSHVFLIIVFILQKYSFQS